MDQPLARLAGLPFVPGTNRRGDVSGAAWTFVLPQLILDRVVCLGQPSISALSRLSLLAARVQVVPDSRSRDWWRDRLSSEGWPNVEVVERLPTNSGDRTDLVWLAGRRSIRSVVRTSEARALLLTAGATYHETIMTDLRDQKRLGDRRNLLLRLSPLLGEARSAVPLEDSLTRRHFRASGLEERWLSRELQRKGVPYAASAGNLLGRVLLAPPLLRVGVLRSNDGTRSLDPPAYLHQLAAAEGVDLAGYRWGLSAKGQYASQKVLMFLYRDTHARPELVAKLSQRPTFSHLLENAERVLVDLQRTQFGRSGRAPRVRFAGSFDGGYAVAEEMIPGAPFVRRAEGTTTDRYVADAISAIEELAQETAVAMPAEAGRRALEQLVARFLSYYELPSSMTAFLHRQPELITSRARTLPVVCWHADPGPQNLLVRKDGRVVLLDWENAEIRGMPLWDLFHFLMTYSIWSSRRRRIESRLSAVRRHFLSGSELTEFIAASIERYRRAIGLRAGLVEPLFWTFLAVQAVREAPRLDPSRLELGHQFRLLRLLLVNAEAPALRRILAGDGHDE